MKTSIVIPNWNGAEKLIRHLPNVLKVKEIDEVIVVDDASTDNGVELIKRDFPKVKLIEKKVNTRFADTVNLGVKNSIGDLVFILNNDASPAPDALRNNLKHFEDPKVFSVSCNSGGNWSWAKFENGFFWHYKSDEKSDKFHQTLWSSGGSGVFRKSIWDNLGGFDTLYSPFYEEDTDLGYRAVKRGYKNIFEPTSIVEHYKEKGVNEQNFSKGFISKTAQRNQLLFIWKNITSQEMIAQHQNQLIKMLLTHPKYWSIFLAALLRLPQVIKKRETEKRDQKLTDEEILSRY